jgi:hypothetical protein
MRGIPVGLWAPKWALRREANLEWAGHFGRRRQTTVIGVIDRLLKHPQNPNIAKFWGCKIFSGLIECAY